MRDSMIEIAGRFGGVEGRRVIVLITDAYDEHSQSSLAEAVAALKEAGVTVYTVGIGGVAGISLRGHDELKAIAADTGGRAFFPSRPTELPNVYDVLANDAQLRYLVTYTPTNQKRDGTWRTIGLRTFDDSMVVKARDGYAAPKPPPVRAVLEFMAMDSRNQYLDIAREDLSVFEDGVEQKVETFQEATSPVSMVLVLDSSGSMKRASEQVVAAAAAFVGALRPEDSLGMLTFADKVDVAHAITTNRASTVETLAGYRAEGGTALYDALCDSMLMLKGLKGRRAVVVFTDGRDEDNPGTGPGSVRSWDSVLRLLQDQEVTMFPVGLGTRIDLRSAEPAGDVFRRRSVLPAGRLGACRAVQSRHRKPQAPLPRGLHIQQSSPRREVAERGDPFQHARHPHHQPQGLLRSRKIGGPRDEARRPSDSPARDRGVDRGRLHRVEHACRRRPLGARPLRPRHPGGPLASSTRHVFLHERYRLGEPRVAGRGADGRSVQPRRRRRIDQPQAGRLGLHAGHRLVRALRSRRLPPARGAAPAGGDVWYRAPDDDAQAAGVFDTALRGSARAAERRLTRPSTPAALAAGAVRGVGEHARRMARRRRRAAAVVCGRPRDTDPPVAVAVRRRITGDAGHPRDSLRLRPLAVSVGDSRTRPSRHRRVAAAAPGAGVPADLVPFQPRWLLRRCGAAGGRRSPRSCPWPPSVFWRSAWPGWRGSSPWRR